MNFIKNLFILTVVFFSVSIFAKKIEIDTKASVVSWKGDKIFPSPHNGVISLKEGSYVEIEGEKILGGEFILDMNTISTTDLTGAMKDRLDGHLKAGDFFLVKDYPTAIFKINSAKKKQSYYDIKGSLNMRGKTNKVRFKMKIDLEKLEAVSSTIILDRQKWGVAYTGSADNLIKDEIEISLKIKGKK